MGLCCSKTRREMPNCAARLESTLIWIQLEVRWFQSSGTTLLTVRINCRLENITPVVDTT